MTNSITRLRCGSANAYLIGGQGGSILVDTGTGRYKDKVLCACKGMSVKLIVLTHGHFDHCQNAAYLAGALGCPVGIGEADIPLLEVGLKRSVSGKGAWGSFYAWAANRNIENKNIPHRKADVILKQGTDLLPYGVDGKIIALPGHTAGSVGVWLSSGELFVGDAMQNIGTPLPAWCYEDCESAAESVRKIRELQAPKVYFGHGKHR